jgi:hypothetical protein
MTIMIVRNLVKFKNSKTNAALIRKTSDTDAPEIKS